MKKNFATCHFSIIINQCDNRVVPISEFLAHACILRPYTQQIPFQMGRKLCHNTFIWALILTTNLQADAEKVQYR